MDFGSGLGHLSKLLSEAGFDVTGVEVTDSAREFSIKHAPKANFLKGLTLEKDKFDAILAIDSLYYVQSPRDVIKTLYKHLNHDGLMVLRVSNRIWFYNLKKLTNNVMVPSPLGDAKWGFSKQGIIKLLSSCGMTTRQVDFIERGKQVNSARNILLYYILSYLAKLSRGLINLSPGMIICAYKA